MYHSLNHTKGKGSWHKDVAHSLDIKRVPQKRAAPERAAKKQKVESKAAPKESATKKEASSQIVVKVEKKVAAKKAAPKTAVPKKKGPKKTAPKKAGNKGATDETILAKMGEMHQMGIMEVDESILLEATGYGRHDSKGYRSAVKKLKDLGYVEKTKTVYKLAESGIEYLLESGVIEIPEEPKTNEEHHAQLLGTLGKLVAAPKGKLEAVFDLLKDGDWHMVDELLEASEYGRTDSKGFRNIISGLGKLGLLEKEGKTRRFSDKAFKFGRP